MQNLPKRVHVIGICGVATSALAIAFHKAGVKVTGSDKGFFPPVSTELESQGVPFYAGWHPEKMVERGQPDVCIVGTASGTQNPETAYAKEKEIPMYSFAEAIGKFFAKKHSIVCVGTWGKTSSSALLSHILLSAGMDPTYMFGGVSLSHESAAHLGATDWSVFEGDEYKSSPTDPTAKFFYYKPTHLLLTAVSWDHADLYPTEEAYFAAFKKLISHIPKNGKIVACYDNPGIARLAEDLLEHDVTFYGKEATSDYIYGDIKQSKSGIEFNITDDAVNKTWAVKSPFLGSFQAENITGCFAMAHELGVPAEKIVAAIASFKGMMRRLEKRLDGDSSKSGVTVFDDIAHSPEKASSVLRELRSIYKGKIIAIFEPNIGGRERAAAAKYDNAFKDADIVVIPRLTKLKTSTEKDAPMEGDELAKAIGRTKLNCVYIDDDDRLVEVITTSPIQGDVIAFLGSHGFRSMIEQTVERLK